MENPEVFSESQLTALTPHEHSKKIKTQQCTV